MPPGSTATNPYEVKITAESKRATKLCSQTSRFCPTKLPSSIPSNIASEEGLLLDDKSNIIFIELTKLKDISAKPITEMSPLEMWAVFLKYCNNKTQRTLLNKIFETRGGIRMAGKLLEQISADDHAKALALSREIFLNDQAADRAAARRKGREEGFLAGQREGRLEGWSDGLLEGQLKGRKDGLLEGQSAERLLIAEKLLSRLDDATITELTGLSLETVQKLRRKDSASPKTN